MGHLLDKMTSGLLLPSWPQELGPWQLWVQGQEGFGSVEQLSRSAEGWHRRGAGFSSTRAAPPRASISFFPLFPCLALCHPSPASSSAASSFSHLSSCLLMCFRHRNFIKAALMSTGFSPRLRRYVALISACTQITLCSEVAGGGRQRRKRSKQPTPSIHPRLSSSSRPCPNENRCTEIKMKH